MLPALRGAPADSDEVGLLSWLALFGERLAEQDTEELLHQLLAILLGEYVGKDGVLGQVAAARRDANVVQEVVHGVGERLGRAGEAQHQVVEVGKAQQDDAIREHLVLRGQQHVAVLDVRQVDAAHHGSGHGVVDLELLLTDRRCHHHLAGRIHLKR